MIDSLAVLEILNTRARRMLDVVSIQLRIYCGQIGKMPQRINEHFKQKVCSLEFIQKAHLVPPERLIKLVLLWYPSLVAWYHAVCESMVVATGAVRAEEAVSLTLTTQKMFAITSWAILRLACGRAQCRRSSFTSVSWKQNAPRGSHCQVWCNMKLFHHECWWSLTPETCGWRAGCPTDLTGTFHFQRNRKTICKGGVVWEGASTGVKQGVPWWSYKLLGSKMFIMVNPTHWKRKGTT